MEFKRCYSKVECIVPNYISISIIFLTDSFCLQDFIKIVRMLLATASIKCIKQLRPDQLYFLPYYFFLPSETISDHLEILVFSKS